MPEAICRWRKYLLLDHTQLPLIVAHVLSEHTSSFSDCLRFKIWTQRPGRVSRRLVGITAQRGLLWDLYKKSAISKVSEVQSSEESLWRQVFQTASEKIESASLAAVTALTSCLSRSVLKSDSEDSLRSFLDLVLKGNLICIYKMSERYHK